jgi:Undecaprenyl-phosphate galactose phosphotransferase WbaP
MTGAITAPVLSLSVGRCRPSLMVAALVASDLLALLLSVGACVVCKSALDRQPMETAYLHLWPYLFVFIFCYSAVGLYSGTALGTPEELRRATFTSAALFLSLSVLTASLRTAPIHVLSPTAIGATILSVILVPLLRSQTRVLFARKSWWGYPAVVFAAGANGRLILNKLVAEHDWGLKPIAVYDAAGDTRLETTEPLYRFTDLAEAQQVAQMCPNAYAVIGFSGEKPDAMVDTIERYISPYFARILWVPEVCQWSSMLMRPRSLGNIFGVEVIQQMALPDRRLPKRVLDIAGSLAAGILFLPLLVLIAIAIKLESPGPVFFGHTRIGKGGKRFKAWKFRTMVTNGAEVLEAHLASSAEARAEWERDHKLRKDPRVTRVGEILRKLSLDELPQIWNVLRNDMSLVGPRPIVDAEVAKYGKFFPLYLRMKGGVTGLWQVSGRNDVSYDARVDLDTFYVRNWSVWLDLYILYRTIGTVLFRHGAY